MRSRVTRSSFVWTSLLLGACGSTDTAELLTCEGGLTAIEEAIAERYTPTRCDADADCILRDYSFECGAEDVTYAIGAVPLHADDEIAYDEAVGAALAETCPGITPGCRGTRDGEPAAAHCMGGTCVAIRDACVARCSECLTVDSCIGHCGSHRACLLDALDCDATRACVSGPPPPGP